MRIAVFPVRGRRWAFGVSSCSSPSSSTNGGRAPAALRHLWQHVREVKDISKRMELVTQYVSDKMEQKWTALVEAPQGSMRSRLHSLGEKLLSKINPSEYFLKSISKDATNLEITYPSSLNPRLVRRRVRLLAMSGAQRHEKYMYGSFVLLPLSIIFGIVPVPNIPLFWNLFRAHANWKALQGSRRLLNFCESNSPKPEEETSEKSTSESSYILVFQPSETLERLAPPAQAHTQAVSDSSIEVICQQLRLDYTQMLKWRDYSEKK